MAYETLIEISAPLGNLIPWIGSPAGTRPTCEVESLTVTGSPTGGTLTLAFGGQITSALAYNSTPAMVQAALAALSSIGSGNLVASGGTWPTGVISITFVSSLGNAKQALVTLQTNSLTGGSSPSLTIAETTAGGVAESVPAPTAADSGVIQPRSQQALHTPMSYANQSINQAAAAYRTAFGLGLAPGLLWDVWR